MSAAIHLLVAAAIAFAPPVAAEPETPPPAVADDDPDRVAAQELYDEGLALYDTFDYLGAIKIWTRAYGKLRATPQNAAARTALVYNIARAQEKAYEQDKDLVHLKRAKSLLEVYVQETGDGDPADLAKARERIAEYDARIREAEQSKPAPAPMKPPAPDRGPRRGTGMTAAGGTMLALGVGTVVGGVTAGVLMSNHAADDIAELGALGDEAARERALARGKQGETIALATGISGGVVALAGAVLVALGAVRMRKDGRATPRAAFAPSLGRGHVGLSFRIGF